MLELTGLRDDDIHGVIAFVLSRRKRRNSWETKAASAIDGFGKGRGLEMREREREWAVCSAETKDKTENKSPVTRKVTRFATSS